MNTFNRAGTKVLIVCVVTLTVGAGLVPARSILQAHGQGLLQNNLREQRQTAQNNLQETQDEEETIRVRDRASAEQAMSRLIDRDPLVRQGAAEELARLSTIAEQRRMIEGYRLQERNPRVRLALDWALYRAGKMETLFQIVRDLDSPRRNQAQSYLLQLDRPEPLYVFLQRVNVPAKVALLQVLAQTGDADTLEMVTALAASSDPQIAAAARTAADEISRRLAQTPATATRPRQVGNGNVTTP